MFYAYLTYSNLTENLTQCCHFRAHLTNRLIRMMNGSMKKTPALRQEFMGE